MWEFFDRIVGFFEMIVDLVVNLFNSLMTFFQMLLQMSFVQGSLALYFPPIIVTSFIVVTAVFAIKLIVGR